MLIFTTNNRAICLSSSEQQQCKTLLAHRWTHRTSPRGWKPPSQISPITAQRRPVYDNDSFHYVTKGVESEQPVGAPCYQWVGCRDHAGIACFPHSGSWQVQRGPVYICRDQRKHVFSQHGTFKIYIFIYILIIVFPYYFELSGQVCVCKTPTIWLRGTNRKWYKEAGTPERVQGEDRQRQSERRPPIRVLF